MVIITSLNNSEKLAKSIAKNIKGTYSKTTIGSFPDGDLYLKFNAKLKGQKLVIVESFQPNSNQVLLNIIFAAKNAKDLGAKKVVLVCPYLAFMRQDKRFNDGEAINAQIMSDLINNSGIDRIITIDPHLHRIKKMKDIFKIEAENLTANELIADFIGKKFKNEVVIGPDSESYQWADKISARLGVEDTVLAKTRSTSRKVSVKVKKEISIKGKNVIIVDDIISTGNTMIKALKEAKKRGAKTVTAIGVHGLFVENAYVKMQKAGFDNIYTVNTIEHKSNKIDISKLISDKLKKKFKTIFILK